MWRSGDNSVMDKKKIIFMGTAEFSASQLETLIKSEEFDIPFVVSQPDKRVGRKQVLAETEVKKLASAYDIEVFQPRKLRDGVLAQKIKEASADLILVVAYGRILPKDVLEAAKLGSINIHASLLPKYRGACPIQMSICEGERETGITYMRMAEGLDEGNILRQYTIPIDDKINSAELFKQMAELSSMHLIDFLNDFFVDKYEELVQDNNEATIVKPLVKDEAEINWELTARKIHNIVRALHEWPVAFTFLDNKRVQIISGTNIPATSMDEKMQERFDKMTFGEIFANKTEIFVKCKDSFYQILEMKVEGSKMRPARELAHNFRAGLKFTYDKTKCGPKVYKYGELN